MTNFEAIGRYHVAVKKAKALVEKRNNILSRAALVLNNVTADLRQTGAAIGKRCNFDAAQNLLTEARAVNDELIAVVDEINELAPVANETKIELV